LHISKAGYIIILTKRGKAGDCNMIPLRDTIPSKHTPIMTWAIIIINAIVFLYQSSLPDRQALAIVYQYAFIPARLAESLNNPAAYIPLFTSMFMHGNWMHIISNMWSLWLFGDNVEDKMGAMRFFIFYILCGLIAGLAHFLSGPNSTVPTLGASGAIAGVMGAYFVLFPHSRIITLIPFIIPFFIYVPSAVFLFVWFISQLYSGIIEGIASRAVGGVAWWAHIFGFLGGVLLYRIFIRRKNSYPIWDDEYWPW
jgi:membrane associated rhomboid family serine protease